MTREQVPWENTIDSRAAMAWREAIVQSNRSAHVVIHVGQDIGRWMRSQSSEWQSTLLWHGFPVVVEPSWATEDIRVRSEVRIP